ncbi:MAG: DUF3465 domain-containing protein [Planctomycetota bacterium]
MAKKPSPAAAKILKQILLLAIPLILRALKKSSTRHPDPPARAQPPGKQHSSSASKTGVTKAKKRRHRRQRRETPSESSAPRRRSRQRSSPIAGLHRTRRSDAIVTDAGVIVKVLPDDNEGSRHQRFLLDVDHTDITIKIAHNIDLAPRVPARQGDRLTFKGEYEYNDLGGALHWTHHDPKQWREGGWIDHHGQRYQ